MTKCYLCDKCVVLNHRPINPTSVSLGYIRDRVVLCEKCKDDYDIAFSKTLTYKATIVIDHISAIKNEMRKGIIRVVRFFKIRMGL